MMKAALMSLAVAALAVTPVAVQAASFSVPASARAFALPGTSSEINAVSDYSTGFFGSETEYRTYFVFNLPTFTGTVSSARLNLAAGTIGSGSFPIRYQLTSLGSGQGLFATLGTGTLYGARDFAPADNGQQVVIDLNSAGVAALTSGGTFQVGGRVTNRLGTTHFLFNGTRNAPVTLEFDTVIAAVPEPASWAMLIIGFGLAGSALRRRRAAIA
jgi:hypothetical protein